MPKTIFILGQGEQGRIIENIFRLSKFSGDIFFFDDGVKKENTKGKLAEAVNFVSEDVSFFVAFGDNTLRKMWFETLQAAGATFINAIHPAAVVEANVHIGVNVFIGALTYINIGSSVGNNTYINNGCTIEHDNAIAANCHVAPGVTTAGGVQVGEGSMLGIGSVIGEDLTIGENTIVGAASNVISNAEKNSIYYGNPAKYVREKT